VVELVVVFEVVVVVVVDQRIQCITGRKASE
jgi:hypothetical protein